ncbi:MAG: hypothetical protein H7833_12130 [Magnetococcus sp. DMHC-1]|nr:hypothetical protein [Magnetococcales bacterium]
MSDQTGKAPKELVEDALSHYLEAWEDRQDMEDARKALDAYRQNPENVVTMDDVLKECGLTREEFS